MDLLLALLFAIQTPADHHIDVFARDLEEARVLLALDDGTLLVSRPRLNDVIALRDRDGDGRADEIRTAVSSVERASGLAMHGDTLYVAGVKTIVAAERQPDGTFSSSRPIADLPNGGQHPERMLAIGPDGKLYVSIGSSCDGCIESDPEHATLLQLDLDGTGRRVFARGLGDLRGFTWHPETRELWGVDAAEINRIGDGLHYGWPFCTGARELHASSATPLGTSKEKFCRDSEAPTLDLRGNVATSFVFNRGDAYAASGSKVVRIRYRDGKPAAFEDFLIGGTRFSGITIAKDGSMLVSDGGTIYRVAHGEARLPAMTSSAPGDPSKAVLAKVFHLDGLHSPQAVVHDEEQDVYFVSNLDGGFIARVSPEGGVLEMKFIEGLAAPRGMAIRGTELWIADGEKLRAFDRVTGASLQTINLAPKGAVLLSNVVVGPDDAIYVTDTDVRMKGKKERVRAGDGRIFRVEQDGDVEVAVSGEELRSPTGIAWDGLRFLVTQAYGNEVLAWSPGSAAKAVMRGPGAYEGIVVLPSGAVIVSSQHDEGLHYAFGTGDLRPLFSRPPAPAGIGFDRKRNRLLVPSRDGDWLEGWTLPPLEPPPVTTARSRVPSPA